MTTKMSTSAPIPGPAADDLAYLTPVELLDRITSALRALETVGWQVDIGHDRHTGGYIATEDLSVQRGFDGWSLRARTADGRAQLAELDAARVELETAEEAREYQVNPS